MTAVSSQVKGAEKITSLFGYWPSFHDAEVLEIALRRKDIDGKPSLTAAIHVFEMTSQVSETGHYICRHHSIVSLHFTDISGLEMDNFNHQNALSGLVIEDVPPPDKYSGSIRVELSSAYGVDCGFLCHSAEVVSIEPGIPPGSVYAGKAA